MSIKQWKYLPLTFFNFPTFKALLGVFEHKQNQQNLKEMANLTSDFFKIPMIYLVKYNNGEDEARYRLYVGMAMGEEESFTLPVTPSITSGCDVYEIEVEDMNNNNSALLTIQTDIRSGIQANGDTIEVRVTDGTTTRRAKMNYDQADNGGVGGWS